MLADKSKFMAQRKKRYLYSTTFLETRRKLYIFTMWNKNMAILKQTRIGKATPKPREIKERAYTGFSKNSTRNIKR